MDQQDQKWRGMMGLGEEWTVVWEEGEATWESTASLPPPLSGEASLLTLLLTPTRVPQGLTVGRAEEVVVEQDSELLKGIMGHRGGGTQVPQVAATPGEVLEAGAAVVKPPG